MNQAVGIDLSTRAVHIVVLDTNGSLVDQQEIQGEGKRASDRFATLAFGTLLWFREHYPSKARVGIEGLPFVKNRNGFGSLAQVLGMVQSACIDADADYAMIDGRKWKALVGLHGNANKEEIRRWGESSRGVHFDAQDFYDAYGVAVCVQEHWREWETP